MRYPRSVFVAMRVISVLANIRVIRVVWSISNVRIACNMREMGVTRVERVIKFIRLTDTPCHQGYQRL